MPTMPTIIRHRVQVNGHVYPIDCYPLDPWLASLPRQPLAQPSPFRQNGYVVS